MVVCLEHESAAKTVDLKAVTLADYLAIYWVCPKVVETVVMKVL